MAMELSDAGQNAVARLQAALQGGPQPGGAWPSDVVDDVLAIVVLAAAPLDELNPIEEAILAAFARRIGMTDGADANALAQKIGEHFVQHPLPTALATEVHAALGEMLKTNSANEAAAQALGTAAGKDAKVPVGQRAAADGATKMGVLGRFALHVKK